MLIRIILKLISQADRVGAQVERVGAQVERVGAQLAQLPVLLLT